MKIVNLIFQRLQVFSHILHTGQKIKGIQIVNTQCEKCWAFLKLTANGRKYGKAGIETTSAILGDPLQSEGFVKAAKEYDIVQKKVKQAEKANRLRRTKAVKYSRKDPLEVGDICTVSTQGLKKIYVPHLPVFVT